jgi:hypothetical protein
MALRSLLALGVASSVAAQDLPHPSVASGGGACEDDWSCSLGGACTAGKCVCDHWTTGPQCNLLNLAHLERDVSTYGLQMPEYHSCERARASCLSPRPALPSSSAATDPPTPTRSHWLAYRPSRLVAGGGHAVQDEAGVWNGFFSFMCNHMSLSSWTTASSIVRATSKSVDGPYTGKSSAILFNLSIETTTVHSLELFGTIS